MEIRHITHKQIDKPKWDWCIRNSINGNLYAWSWYLDAVCPGWEALVTDNYEVVMPLSGRKKYGFHYLFRPLLNQQLGVFSLNILENSVLENFLQAIPKKYRLIEINLNKYNTQIPARFKKNEHASYELDLISEYSDLYEAFKQNTKRNLKKASSYNLEHDGNISAKEFFHLLQQDKSAGSTILNKPENIRQLYSILQAFKHNEAGRITGIREQNGELITACLFGKSHQKWYFLAPVNSDAGKEKGALSMLIDSLIRELCGQSLTLDFEGSDIPGVARFYAGFGAKPYQYASIKENSLPWPIKLLKG